MVAESGSHTGDIQVLAEAGCRVQVDGRVVGVTRADEGGLLIKGLPAGPHAVRVVRDGFSEQSFTFPVEPGQVAVVRVGVVLKEMRVRQVGQVHSGVVEQQVGHLKVITLPVNGTLEFMGTVYEKQSPELHFENVPVGSYPVAFRTGGQSVEGSVVIRADEWREIKVDLPAGRIEDLTALRQVAMEREREEERRKIEALRSKTEAVERRYRASQRPVLFELHPEGELFPDRDPGTGRYDYQCFTFEVQSAEGRLLKPLYTNLVHTIEVFGGRWETLRIAYERIKVRSLWLRFKRRYDIEIRSVSPFTTLPKPGTKVVLRLSHPEERCVVELLDEIPDFIPEPD
jgi:hypothetical protein